ncbi:MAG TPA: hypothetical protein VK932_08850 [Kofleriaceae bacterium]|nr:hypothetical protein [Kofleriaceae bacterium]
MTKRRSDLVQFQIEAAERRRLLDLGKIVVEDPPDPRVTRAFTRQVQIAVNERKKLEPSKG